MGEFLSICASVHRTKRMHINLIRHSKKKCSPLSEHDSNILAPPKNPRPIPDVNAKRFPFTYGVRVATNSHVSLALPEAFVLPELSVGSSDVFLERRRGCKWLVAAVDAAELCRLEFLVVKGFYVVYDQIQGKGHEHEAYSTSECHRVHLKFMTIYIIPIIYAHPNVKLVADKFNW